LEVVEPAVRLYIQLVLMVETLLRFLQLLLVAVVVAILIEILAAQGVREADLEAMTLMELQLLLLELVLLGKDFLAEQLVCILEIIILVVGIQELAAAAALVV
jgi:hypothetical protein